MRSGVALGFEDALGLARALSMLGGGYTAVALQLLKVRVCRGLAAVVPAWWCALGPDLCSVQRSSASCLPCRT